ncbi:hypothetical protein [Ruegeria sp. Ofav3-42]|uniref:hypothetical protein n=1 Tax=Ruegeria sp. Ofav3-42 TaxID=2917759 RepID=UPI001EF59CAF|nr:hypothetical protein [Ruegeria sp. Ofav3-42]MCG7520185.1 hypothetical protein [Ruegeria sp. Ofav3-42]
MLARRLHGCLIASAFCLSANVLVADELNWPESICSELEVDSREVVSRLRQNGWIDADDATQRSAMLSEQWIGVLNTYFWENGLDGAEKRLAVLNSYTGNIKELYFEAYQSRPEILMDPISDGIVIAGTTDIKGTEANRFYFDLCYHLMKNSQITSELISAAVAKEAYGTKVTPASRAYNLRFRKGEPRRTDGLLYVELLPGAFEAFGDNAPVYWTQIRRTSEQIVVPEVSE